MALSLVYAFLNFVLMTTLWVGIILILQMRKLRLRKVNKFERLASESGFLTLEPIFFHNYTTFMCQNTNKLEQIIGRDKYLGEEGVMRKRDVKL